MKRFISFIVMVTVGLVIAIAAGPRSDTQDMTFGKQPRISSGDIPELINFQGVLTDHDGNPLDTTVSISFTVYDAQTGGKALWTDTYAPVTVTAGLFTILLDIPSTVFEEAERWMGLKVGADDEMTPRQRIGSVPYAYWSGGGSSGDGCWQCPNAPGSGPVYTLLGAVGIGTSNPTPIDAGRSALHIAGSFTPALVLEQTGAHLRKWDFFPSGVDGALLIRDRTAGSTAYRFMIDPDGNVGVGTTDPVELLDVAGSIAMAYGGHLRVRNSYPSGSSYIMKNGWESPRGDYLDFYVPGADQDNVGAKMSITETGNVGIGATNPGGHRLHVVSNGSAVAGATAFIQNTHATGIGMIVEAASSDLPLCVSQKGTGDIFRCDSWTGGWHVAFRVNNEGKTTCSALTLTGGSDIAEPFDVEKNEMVEPGMLMTIDPDNPGKLRVSQKAYDRRVAGIVSGAAGIEPGMVMGQSGSIADGRFPVALSGRVYCRTDASAGPIRPGDLLTTSDTPGHAMKVTDYERAQGAVIGKAMTSLDEGLGLVLVLVTLQ